MIATLPAPSESLTTTSSGVSWQVIRCHELPSTNSAAALLAPWHAVIAATQTGGYGRTRNPWVSDVGGLWLSAVLPLSRSELPWQLLPLVVGCAVAETLSHMGVRGHHVRWPNDLLIGERKIAGILVEKFQPDTAVVGIGLNVLNDPARRDPSLQQISTSLSQHWDYPRTLREVSEKVLQDLAAAHQRFAEHGFEPFARALNLHWSHRCRIEYRVQGESAPVRARYIGIGLDGTLEVLSDAGTLQQLDPTRVHGLREIAE